MTPPAAAHTVDVALRDGSTVRIRPVRPEDRDGLRALLGGLSDDARWMRFLSAGREPRRRRAARGRGRRGRRRAGGHGGRAGADRRPRRVRARVGRPRRGRVRGRRRLERPRDRDDPAGAPGERGRARRHRHVRRLRASAQPQDGRRVPRRGLPGRGVRRRRASWSSCSRPRWTRTRAGASRTAAAAAAVAAVAHVLAPASVVLVGDASEPASPAGAVLRNLAGAGYRGELHRVGEGAVEGVGTSATIAPSPDGSSWRWWPSTPPPCSTSRASARRRACRRWPCCPAGFADAGDARPRAPGRAARGLPRGRDAAGRPELPRRVQHRPGAAADRDRPPARRRTRGRSRSPPRAARSGSRRSPRRAAAGSASPRSSPPATRRTCRATTSCSTGSRTRRRASCCSTSSRSATRAASGRSRAGWRRSKPVVAVKTGPLGGAREREPRDRHGPPARRLRRDRRRPVRPRGRDPHRHDHRAARRRRAAAVPAAAGRRPGRDRHQRPRAGDRVRRRVRRRRAEPPGGTPLDLRASATAEDYAAGDRPLAADPGVDAVMAIFVPPLVTRARGRGRRAAAPRAGGAARRCWRSAWPRTRRAARAGGERRGPVLRRAGGGRARARRAWSRYARWRARPAEEPPSGRRRRRRGGRGARPRARPRRGVAAPGGGRRAARRLRRADRRVAARRDARGGGPARRPSWAARWRSRRWRRASRTSPTWAAWCSACTAPRRPSARRARRPRPCAGAGREAEGFVVQRMAPAGRRADGGRARRPGLRPRRGVRRRRPGDRAGRRRHRAPGAARPRATPPTWCASCGRSRCWTATAARRRSTSAALEDILVRLSLIAAAHAEVLELDCGPVLVSPEGALVLDARVRVRVPGRRPPVPGVGSLVPGTRGIYLTGCEPATGKSAVALGLHELLSRRIERLGVFRPGDRFRRRRPAAAGAARGRAEGGPPPRRRSGSATRTCAPTSSRALEEIVTRFHALAAQCDGVLVVGTDFAGVGTAERAGVQRPRGAQPRAARAVRRLGPRTHGGRGALRRVGRAAPRCAASAARWRGWWPTGSPPPRSTPSSPRRAGAAAAAARAPRGRAADGADGRRDRGRLPRRGRRRQQPGGAGPRGAQRARGGDDAAQPAGADHRERAADRAGRPRRRAAHRLLRAGVAARSRPSPASCSRAACARPHALLEPLDGLPPIILTEHDTYETATLASHRRGQDQRERAAQDHRGAGAVRAARRRRRAARPARGLAPVGGDAADVPARPARPRARRPAADRAAGGHRRAHPARRRDPAAPPGGRADAAGRRGRGPRRRRPARRGHRRAPPCSTPRSRRCASASRRSTRSGARTRASRSTRRATSSPASPTSAR